MESLVLFVFAAAAIAAFIACFWYLFQTLRIMWRYSALIAIAAVLFSPLVHMIFYIMPKKGFDNQDKRLFNRYFLSIVAIIVIAIGAASVIPATTQDRPEQNDDYQDAAFEAHLSRIYEAHPDADAIVDSAKFRDWWQGKPESERQDYDRVLNEGSSSEIIHMLTLFKIETGGF